LNKIGKVTVTQQMVADAAGVHLSTVSLALRNDARLPEQTRKKIQAVAQKLGYTPNPLVSLLMSRVRRRNAGYRGTLGYVHTVPKGTAKLAGPVHRNFLAGARQRAMGLGYHLDEFFLEADATSGRRLARMLMRAASPGS
jgi:LacI family transcriptional regulator